MDENICGLHIKINKPGIMDKLVFFVHPLWNIEDNVWDSSILGESKDELVLNNADRDIDPEPIWADLFNLARRPGKIYQELIAGLQT